MGPLELKQQTFAKRLSQCPKENIHVHQRTIMNKHVSILSTPRIVHPINTFSFLTTDICSASLGHRDYIIAFEDTDVLKEMKEIMQHPYDVSHVKIDDIAYYLQQSDKDLLILDTDLQPLTLLHLTSDDE